MAPDTRSPAGGARPLRTLLFLAANASYSHSSLAAACLQAAVSGNGWRWITLETHPAMRRWDVLERMVRAQPDAVAAGLYLFNQAAVLEILSRFRALRPDCPAIAGGPECDGDNEPLLRQAPCLDLVIRGEGELALRAWLPLYLRRRSWRGIPGACFLDRAGVYHDGGWATAEPDLDRLPSPCPFLPMGSRRPFMPYESTRGCANRCAFCCSGRRQPVRRLSLERIRSDLRLLRARGVKTVRLLDRTFNDSSRHALPRMQLFRNEFPDMRFHLEIDPARVDDALLDTLRAAPRAWHLEAGLQTLDRTAWRLSGRLGDPHTAWAGLHALCSIPGLDVHVDLIAGMPGAGLRALRRDVRALVGMGPAEIQLEVLKLLPGTRWRREARSLGLVHAADPPYEVLCTPDMPLEATAYASDLSRGMDWFYNHPGLQPAVRRAARRHGDLWDRMVRYVREHASGPGAPGLDKRMTWLAACYPGDPALRHTLLDAWLRAGFGERGLGSTARRWIRPVPATAVLLEGSDQRLERGLRRYTGRPDTRLLYEYGRDERGGRQTNVYGLPEADAVNEATGPG